MPIEDFARGTDLDLSSVVAVRFEVGEGSGSARGRVALDDVMIVR